MLLAGTTIIVAITTVDPTLMGFLLFGTPLLIALSAAARALVARFEADSWGIRCTNPFTNVRIPWSDMESLEPRGKPSSPNASWRSPGMEASACSGYSTHGFPPAAIRHSYWSPSWKRYGSWRSLAARTETTSQTFAAKVNFLG